MCEKRDIAITCEFCRELRLTFLFSGLYKKTRLKESEVWRTLFQTKLLAHTVCRLLSSLVLLCKFTIAKAP